MGYNINNSMFSLDKIPLKILISTVANILCLDLESQTIEVLLTKTRPRQYYYGLSWSDDYLFVADSDQPCPADCVRIYDKKFNLVDTFFEDLGQIHQIQYYNGKLYITDTAHDACKVHLLESGETTAIFLSEEHDSRRHINSLYVDKDLYVVCHGRYDPSTVSRIDVTTYEVLETWKQGIQSHNVCKIDDQIWVNSSKENCLLGRTGEVFYRTSPENSHYLRGLSVTQDYVLIGESFYNDHRDDRVGRDARCMLSILEKSSRKVLGHVKIGSPSIYEIRTISENDFAHSSISNEFWV